MRTKSKMINYGIVYGLSAFGMADRLDIPQSEADEFINRYLDGFPAVKRFIEETIEQGTEHGYVSTLFGRRRQVPELRARRWDLRKQGERFAVNMVIQGTAADIMKVAMVRCDRALTRGGPALAPDPADPRRAAVRGAGPRAEPVKALPREMIARSRWTPRSRSTSAGARTGSRPSSSRSARPRRAAARGWALAAGLRQRRGLWFEDQTVAELEADTRRLAEQQQAKGVSLTSARLIDARPVRLEPGASRSHRPWYCGDAIWPMLEPGVRSAFPVVMLIERSRLRELSA